MAIYVNVDSCALKGLLLLSSAIQEKQLQSLNVFSVCKINAYANHVPLEKLLTLLINFFNRLLKVGPTLVLAVLEQNFQD